MLLRLPKTLTPSGARPSTSRSDDHDLAPAALTAPTTVEAVRTPDAAVADHNRDLAVRVAPSTEMRLPVVALSRASAAAPRQLAQHVDVVKFKALESPSPSTPVSSHVRSSLHSMAGIIP